MAHDALFVSDKESPTMPYLRDKLAPAYLRAAVEPFGYGYGRDPEDPNVGKWRYIKSHRPAGVIVVPNEIDSPDANYKRYEWEKLEGEDGVQLGTEKQGEDNDDRCRERTGT